MRRGAAGAAASSMASLASAAASPPIAARSQQEFRLGIIADVQYADVDDGTDFSGLAHRRYRNAQTVLARAAQDWRAQGVRTVVQLGDLVDGKNAASEDKRAAFLRVLKELEGFDEVHHIVGNHDLYNLTKSELSDLFRAEGRWPRPSAATSGAAADAAREAKRSDALFYYSFAPCPGWRCIVLDAYELTAIGPDASEDAKTLLSASNPNKWWETGVNFQTGLDGPMKRHVPYNGALSSDQLAWFAAELAQASAAEQRVIVFVHNPLYPLAQQPANRYTCLPWNYHDVLAVLEAADAEVAGVFSGHDHAGGAAKHRFLWRGKERAVPHYSLRAAVEAEAPTCHATLVLTAAGLRLENAHALHPLNSDDDDDNDTTAV